MKFTKKLWKDFLICVRIFFNCENKKHFFGSDVMKYNFNKKDVSQAVSFCSITAEGFKTACASLNFVVPLSEKASLFALIPNVLTRSSEKYPDLTAIEKKLALLYGAEVAVDVSKSGEQQNLKIEISCIDDRFAIDGESISDECCEMLFELVFNPKLENGAFEKNVVESEKRLLCERLAAEKSDKRAYAKNRCEEIMFSDEVYGINRLGTIEAIEAVTPESLYDAYNELLKTAVITMCVSGGRFSNAEKLFEAQMQNISREPELNETLFVESAEDVQYEKEQEDVKQGKLVMGFRMGMKNIEDNYSARRIMVDLFGGSPHSKLFTVVREKMSLCYYCSARFNRNKGVMFVQSGIESYNEEKAREAILAQLDDIKNGNFSDEDLQASKKSLEDGFKTVTDSPEALDSWFTSQTISGKYLYPEDFIDGFNKVTREDVINAAKDVTLDTVFMLEGTAEGGDEE